MPSQTKKPLIAISAPVEITAGEADGDKKGPAKFIAEFYTGGAMSIEGWDLPVVIDLAGLSEAKVLVANLDHVASQRVGNFAVANDGKSLVANGTATAKTAARDEVVESAKDGYQWQASLEVQPQQVDEVKTGKTIEVNGQTLEGPLYVTRKGTLKGFAFVSHGADDNTSATIAASAAPKKGILMKAEVKAWAEKMGVDTANLDEDQVATIEANYEGMNGGKPAPKKPSNPFEARKLEARRRSDIRETADKFISRREDDYEYIEATEKMVEHAIEANMSAQDFRNEMYEQSVPFATTVPKPRERDNGYSNRVLTAALCQLGRLPNIDKHFTDQELQTAHDKFPSRISLGQLFHICAEARGYRGNGNSQVTLEVQRAAFGLVGPRQIQHIHAGQGFSTIDIATIVSATANKFVMDGWNAVDQTALRIASIRPVRNFQAITTVSLTDSLRYEQLGADGEIKHGTLDEITYTNQADTYAKMLAITRKDIINDDAGALTSVPRKLGNGAMKLLNHIFWTEFLGLVAANFFAAGNSNINTGVADMTLGGLDATEAIFMDQTQPDGTPLALQPAILLVPSALRNKALALVEPGSLMTSGATAGLVNTNVFAGRFRVESSPYISNSTYTGATSVGYWMLANPSELPVIEIVALNGRVEPTVDTADTDFNTLGVQMRGYCDVGVRRQEYRAGVYADGGAS